MSFDFGLPRRSRQARLTPMIDVVFLLLIFFMLAARLGGDQAIPLRLAAGTSAYEGPPRLIEIAPGGLRLNGLSVELAALPGALAPLMAGPDDLVVIAPARGVALQGLVDVIDSLRAAGLGNIAVLEAG